MAKKLAAFPESARSRQGHSRYNWTEWLDGSAWELEYGKDFTVPARSFRSAASQAAKAKEGYITTTLRKVDGQDEPNVVIQYLAEKEKPHAPTSEDMTEDSRMTEAELASST